MERIKEALQQILRGLSRAVFRFPLTVLCLACAAGLTCYMISLHTDPGLTIQKLMFTFWLGSFLGVTAQFCCERFERLNNMRLAIYGLSAVLTVGYYLILWPAPSISFGVVTRTFVAVFAMFCAFLWVPSYGGEVDFNRIALTHLKAAFTSVLYAGVLAAGCAAIIGAIDILLFNISNDAYAYMMVIIWMLFATIYYLSLLPHFNSEDEADREYTAHVGMYPKFLEILVSYIAIPLVAAYTLVLIAYFVKILLTLHWPSGQLGVMVLAYSAAGLTIYVLASLLENRFAAWYRIFFPKVLIPVVVMQFVSVAIRLNAYGITESRYYVVLFGIFSIVCGLFLSFKPVSKNGIIALLAAGLAILSVVPPIDAFTVSRVSQITRLENMLQREGVLQDGKLTPKAEVSDKVRAETTNILSYLEMRSYIKYVKWLPADFKNNDQMKNTLGFEPFYGNEMTKNFFANIDVQKPFDIGGYDVFVNTSLYRNMDKSAQPAYDLEVKGIKYKLAFEPVSSNEVRVSVKNSAGAELVGTGLYSFAKSLTGTSNTPKESLPPEKMTFDVEKDGYKLRIIFQNINITEGSGVNSGIDYSLFVLFAAAD